MPQEISREEWMKLVADLGKRGGSTLASSGGTGGQSSTITSREVDYGGGGGGGGGMDMVSGFTNLGDKLHRNALSTIGMFSSLEDKRREQRRQTMLDAEDKRRFEENLNLSTRDRNLAGMEHLAGIRGAAGQRRRMPFRSALTSAILR